MEFLFGAFILFLYFLPTLVAARRGHPNATPIGIINLFFGWTLIGWVACLAWAYSAAADVLKRSH